MARKMDGSGKGKQLNRNTGPCKDDGPGYGKGGGRGNGKGRTTKKK